MPCPAHLALELIMLVGEAEACTRITERGLLADRGNDASARDLDGAKLARSAYMPEVDTRV